jgi:hypothetical protein
MCCSNKLKRWSRRSSFGVRGPLPSSSRRTAMHAQYRLLSALSHFSCAPGSPRIDRWAPPRGNGAGVPTVHSLIGDAAESCRLSRSDEVRAMPAHRRGRSHRTERAGSCQCQRHSRRRPPNWRNGAGALSMMGAAAKSLETLQAMDASPKALSGQLRSSLGLRDQSELCTSGRSDRSLHFPDRRMGLLTARSPQRRPLSPLSSVSVSWELSSKRTACRTNFPGPII